MQSALCIKILTSVFEKSKITQIEPDTIFNKLINTHFYDGYIIINGNKIKCTNPLLTLLILLKLSDIQTYVGHVLAEYPNLETLINDVFKKYTHMFTDIIEPYTSSTRTRSFDVKYGYRQYL
jgi:hypothetical protein